jgi:hypothetical protein
MQPNRFRFVFAFLCVFLIEGARADLLDKVSDGLSIQSPRFQFQLQLSGLLDLETYYIDQRPPGLIQAADGLLFNPRLSIFVDANWTKHLYFFAQARIDRGFDPRNHDAEIRADEYVLRYTPLDDARINFQIGKFATVVGNWVPRHLSWDNPFINAPLPYENVTGIWDSEAPDDTDDLLGWAHVGKYDSGDYSDKFLRLPIIWGANYGTGVAVTGSIGRFDYAAEMKNSALASRPEYWDLTERAFSNPTFSGRIGFRPNEMFNFGVSASAGPYLNSEAAPTLPPDRSVGDYREFVLAQDASFAWHHLQLWAECFETTFQVPRIGNANTLAYYFEAKYKITPQLFTALRWNQQLYATVRDEDSRAQWGNDLWRVDAAVGYRFTNWLQGKLQYSFTRTDSKIQVGEQFIAAQLTAKF